MDAQDEVEKLEQSEKLIVGRRDDVQNDAKRVDSGPMSSRM